MISQQCHFKVCRCWRLPWLDTKQVVFAQVYDGLDVLDAIAAVEVDENGVPKENVVINSMSVENIKASLLLRKQEFRKSGVLYRIFLGMPAFSSVRDTIILMRIS